MQPCTFYVVVQGFGGSENRYDTSRRAGVSRARPRITRPR